MYLSDFFSFSVNVGNSENQAYSKYMKKCIPGKQMTNATSAIPYTSGSGNNRGDNRNDYLGKVPNHENVSHVFIHICCLKTVLSGP